MVALDPWMKNWVETNYVDIQSLSVQELKGVIQEAYEAVYEEFLLELAHSNAHQLRISVIEGGRKYIVLDILNKICVVGCIFNFCSLN